MTNIDQQIIDLLRPVLAAAKAIDPRAYSIGVIVDEKDEPYYALHGSRAPMSYGFEKFMAGVKPFDPEAEKRAAIEQHRAAIAALESETK